MDEGGPVPSGAVTGDRFPLPRFERRLQERVQTKLPQAERVLAAIKVFTGPRAGVEGCLIPFAVLGLPIFLLSVLGVGASRKNFTLAITDKRGVLFRDDWIGRPTRIIATFSSLDDIGPLNDTDGDPFVVLGGEKFWTGGEWSGQLYRIRKIKQGWSPVTPPAG